MAPNWRAFSLSALRSGSEGTLTQQTPEKSAPVFPVLLTSNSPDSEIHAKKVVQFTPPGKSFQNVIFSVQLAGPKVFFFPWLPIFSSPMIESGIYGS